MALAVIGITLAPRKVSAAAPDTLLLTDGEKLIGQLQSATDTAVSFKSDVLGVVSVDWSKVQELRTSEKFVAVPKNARLRRLSDANNLPAGDVSATAEKLTFTPAPNPPAAAEQTVPVNNVAHLVSESALQQAFRNEGFFSGWKGGATAGISLTEATQKDQTFTGAINLSRPNPGESWLETKSRTLFDLNEAYGQLTQPNTPTVKTSLFHLDAEQDWYLSTRLYTFGEAAFDHSFSQGLKLQQNYGGGFGFVVLKSADQELDLKASVNYIRQEFEVASLNVNLIGSAFGDTYTRKFAHGIVLNEQTTITPAWNQLHDYTATASAGLTFPVYHRVGFTIGALDSFINNPPPAFKKNSFQLTIGSTYSFQ
jgi:hypothetical protein